MPSNTTFEATQDSQLNSQVVMYNAQGVSQTANVGPKAVTNIDLVLADDHELTGGHLIVAGAKLGDFCHLQVVDKDNILGLGTNTILRQFVTSWFLSDTDRRQGEFSPGYPAKVRTGLYLRVVYNSTAMVGATPPFVAMNYDLHKIILPAGS
jgi:hypothetical protein